MLVVLKTVDVPLTERHLQHQRFPQTTSTYHPIYRLTSIVPRL